MDAEERDLKASHKLGFHRVWTVGQRHEIRGGKLYEAEAGESAPRRIAPAASPYLVRDLCNLDDGDEDAVIRFANRWGLLGYWELTGRVGGEPLDWIWAHARGTRVCVSLVQHLKRNQVEQTLHDLRGQLRPHLLMDWPVLTYGADGQIVRGQWLPQGKKPTELGWEIVRDIINQNLGGVTEQLHTVDPGNLQRTHVFRALVNVIYWRLARLVEAKRLAQCNECGNLFEQTDARQRFCPPEKPDSPDATPLKESPCAKRANARQRHTNAKAAGLLLVRGREGR